MNVGGPTSIIKRGGRRPAEDFDVDKLRKSVESACLSAGTTAGHAESIARTVVREVSNWASAHPEVTSEDIRRTATESIKKHHPDAAYLYDQHRLTL